VREAHLKISPRASEARCSLGVLGVVVTRGPRTLKVLGDFRDPQILDGRLEVQMERPNSFHDVVGCASRRRTSPEPLVPEIDRVEDG